MKKAQNASRSVTWLWIEIKPIFSATLFTACVAAHLQHVALVEHDAVVDRHFDLAADHAVEEATVVGQLQLAQALVHRVAVLHHDLFGHDAHVEQIAIEHFLAVAEARVQPRVGVWVADQRISSPTCSTASPSGLARMPLRRMRSM